MARRRRGGCSNRGHRLGGLGRRLELHPWVGQGVECGGDREEEHHVFPWGDIYRVGVADPNPLLRDLGDHDVITFDLVFMIEHVALCAEVWAVLNLDTEPGPNRRDQCLLHGGNGVVIWELNLHGVANACLAFLNLVELATLKVLEDQGFAHPQGLPIDPERPKSGSVLDVRIVADREKSFLHDKSPRVVVAVVFVPEYAHPATLLPWARLFESHAHLG